MKNITYEWKLIKKLFPSKHRKTIEAALVELYESRLYMFTAHRDNRLNYRLNIPDGSIESVGFIRLK